MVSSSEFYNENADYNGYGDGHIARLESHRKPQAGPKVFIHISAPTKNFLHAALRQTQGGRYGEKGKEQIKNPQRVFYQTVQRLCGNFGDAAKGFPTAQEAGKQIYYILATLACGIKDEFGRPYFTQYSDRKNSAFESALLAMNATIDDRLAAIGDIEHACSIAGVHVIAPLQNSRLPGGYHRGA